MINVQQQVILMLGFISFLASFLIFLEGAKQRKFGWMLFALLNFMPALFLFFLAAMGLPEGEDWKYLLSPKK